MSNTVFKSHFLNSLLSNPAMIGLRMELVQPVRAFLVNQGLTYTAVQYGSGGEAITIALTGGGVAGAEVVSVVANAISIQIQSGVSTRDDIIAAVQASVPASALISISGAGAVAVTAPLAPTALAGSVDSVGGFSGAGVESVDQTGTGEYSIVLSDSYGECLGPMFQLESVSDVDLHPQVKSCDVGDTKTIVVNLLDSSATPTDLSGAANLYLTVLMNDSVLYYSPTGR